MSNSYRSSIKPSIALSKVPSVKELCERLGFQRASLKETNVFLQATHAWRKSYTTSEGESASTLLAWKSSIVQVNLRQMAESFIDHMENGTRFWDPSRSWGDDSDLQFPQDRSSIVELLMQMFWKQNRYAANNSNYGSKAVESRDTSLETPIPAPESRHASSSTLEGRNDGRVRQVINFEDSVEVHSTHPTTSSPGLYKLVYNTTEQENDVFEILDDSEEMNDTAIPQSPRHHLKHARDEQTVHQSPRRKKSNSKVASPRRTERKPHPRAMPKFVINEEIEQVLGDIESEELDGSTTFKPVRDMAADIEKEPVSILKPSAAPLFAAPTAPMVNLRDSNGSISDAKSLESAKSMKIRLKVAPGRGATAQTGQSVNSPPSSTMPSQKQPVSQTKSLGRAPPAKATTDLASARDFANTPVGHNTTSSKAASISSPYLPRDEDELLGTFIEQTASAQNDLLSNTSRQPPKPSLTPSSISSGQESVTTIEQPSGPHIKAIATSLPQNPAPSRSKTQIPFWIITHTPRYTKARWHNGKLSGISLTTFFSSISSELPDYRQNRMKEIKLTLRTSIGDTQIKVFSGDEEWWDTARETIMKELKDSLALARKKGVVEGGKMMAGIEIFIEPSWEDGDVDHDGGENEAWEIPDIDI